MVSNPHCVLSVRGRPIRYEPSRFGGGLVAADRGYFPVSHTGYRSLARGLDAGDAPPPSLEFLETLAMENDRQTADVLRRTRKTLGVTTAHPLAYFDALRAVEYGFFAPDTDRAHLWRSALLLTDRILRDPLLQPSTATLPNWTDETCARSMTRTRLLDEWLRHLLAGSVTPPPQEIHLFDSYWRLPARATPEPIIGLPDITAELGLDMPSFADVDADEPDEDGESDEAIATAADEGVDPELAPSPAVTENAHQLALF